MHVPYYVADMDLFRKVLAKTHLQNHNIFFSLI